MRSCFSFDEIRKIEGKIIETEKVSSIVLMENAGKNSCDAIIDKIPGINEKDIFILCGKGNNGGDGFTLARHFLIKNISCKTVMLVPASGLKGDAAINYELLRNSGGEFIEFIEFIQSSSKFSKRKNIVLVDAILGTGIRGML
ncbi:MAG: NAD(P)H-hydrate epimerase, partial [Ignavibacteria bacterium]